MLAQTTIDIIRSALRSDPTTTLPDRKRLLALLQRGQETPKPDTPPEARIVRRAEAARRLGCSVRLIDRLAREGVLPKRRLPGRLRAHGIAEVDLAALIQQQPQQQETA